MEEKICFREVKIIMERKKKKIIISVFMLLMAILWALFIYKLSDMNTSNSNGKSTGFINIFIEDSLQITNKYNITDSHPNDSKIDKASRLLNAPLRKVAHASVYFVLAFILVAYINYMFDNKKFLLSTIIVLALCVGYATSDEYHQTRVEGRTGQVKDVVIDSIGTLAGITFYSTYLISYKIGYSDCKKYEICGIITAKAKGK